MSTRLRPAIFFAALLFLYACGDDDDVSSDPDPAAEETTDADGTTDDDTDDTDDTDDDGDGDGDGDDGGTDDAGDGGPAATASSEFGEILVDADGFTLYGFTNDSDGTPTCTDDCAGLWPPLFVDSDELPEGLDSSVFSVVEHPTGQFQLKAGDWPLYRYSPDAAPGDTGGQGVGGIWFVVDPQGELIME